MKVYAFLLIPFLADSASTRHSAAPELAGVWQLRIEVSVDSASRNRKPSAITGNVALLGNPSYGAYEWVTALNATYFGVFTWNKELFELPSQIRGALDDQFWEVAAETQHGDSVKITLRPRLIHGSMILSGRFEGETIRGAVSVQGYGLSNAGAFVLRRR